MLQAFGLFAFFPMLVFAGLLNSTILTKMHRKSHEPNSLILCQAILKLHNTASAGFVLNPHTGYIHLLSVSRPRQCSQSAIVKQPEQARSQALPLHTQTDRQTQTCCVCACVCLQVLPLLWKPANLLMPCRYSLEGNRAFHSPMSEW